MMPGRRKNGRINYTEHDEIRQVQEKRIDHYKQTGDRHITDDGRGAKITIHLVLQARAKMSGNKVKTFEEAFVRNTSWPRWKGFG